MRTILAAAMFLSASFIAASGAVMAAPNAGAQLDGKILKACETEGGKPAECVCGLKIAKEEMTQRELELVPILYPIAKGPGDTFTKLGLGMNAAKAAGYTEQEAMNAVLKVANQSSRTEKECKAS